MFEPAVTVTEQNRFSGAGPIESFSFLIKSCQDIQTADDSDKAALGASIGLGVVAVGLDTARMVINPLGTLISAGLGWLIEHVGFLRDSLDALAGDPDAIQKLADEMHATAESLRAVADEHRAALGRDIAQWTGATADAFRAQMDAHTGNIEAAAKATEVAGYVMHTNMAVIAAVRALVRDLITGILADFISLGLIALATAIPTFGASIVGFISYAIASATALAANIAAKFAQLVATMGRSAARLGQLGGILRGRPRPPASTGSNTPPPPAPVRPPGGGVTTPSGGPDIPLRPLPPAPPAPRPTPTVTSGTTTPAGAPPPIPPRSPLRPPPVPIRDPARPPAVPPRDPARPPAVPPRNPSRPPPVPPRNPLRPPPPHNPAVVQPGPPPPIPPRNPLRPPPGGVRPPSGPWMKRHEDWLKQRWPEHWSRLKYLEDTLKRSHPDVHKVLRTMNDLDSAKEWLGWAAKPGYELARQLLDIQSSAQAAWQAEQNANQG